MLQCILLSFNVIQSTAMNNYIFRIFKKQCNATTRHARSSERCFDKLNHYLQLTIFQTPILLHYKEHCREPDSKVGKVYKIRFSKSNLDFSQPAVNKSKQTIVSNYPQKAI